MNFGIREKVALLVMVATAASAWLVAEILSKAGADAVREHELVDLGDEALVRGWTLADQITGLNDDILKLSHEPEFIEQSHLANLDEKRLAALAQLHCRRYWKRYLRIDICESSELGLAIEEKAKILDDGLWFPKGKLARRAIIDISPIQRREVAYDNYNGVGVATRWEPVVTAVALIQPDNPNSEKIGKRLYLRISMSLDNSKSPRHLFYLEGENHDPLVRHDDNETSDDANMSVFEDFHHEERVSKAFDAALEKRRSKESRADIIAENPKVLRLASTEKKGVPLKSNYYFLEGIPGDMLKVALAVEEEVEFERFLNFLMASGEKSRFGRVGGLKGGVKEVRLLAPSLEKLEKLKIMVEKLMEKHYGEKYDGISWRDEVLCTKIHAWAVLLFVGQGDDEQHYLLHYAVMDEELASAIKNEMKSLRYISIGIATGFGVVGFFIVMYFISPLKKMTRTAQKITESQPDHLFENLNDLVRDLDITRRDEVGDIARSSKRLFEELISFHEQLEQRVIDRTRELRKSNIDLEQAYDQLMSLSHEKDAFVAKVSHDLRQPLNAIFLQVEALKLSDLDDLQKSDVERIHDHARRELNLVNDILEYQKIIMGAETLKKDEIDIAKLIKDIADAHEPGAEAKGLQFEIQFEEGIGSLIADDQRLHQVLGNLVGNACKFTKEGSVSIHANAREISGEDWVEFTITDTGRGMSPEEQSKVFVPFVSNKKDNAGGTGLGLSICKELTGQMGGKIGFVSELDKGTHFSVFMPRVPTSDFYNEKKSDGPPNPINKILSDKGGESEGDRSELRKIAGGGGTILVIDDDENVRELLSRLLKGDGYKVITAEDGNVGLEMAREHSPDAITLDVVMPGGKDGWEVLKNLKESPETESIPVIMVSVMAAAENGVALDVEDYLVKPIDVNRLKRVMSRVTRQSPQRNLLLVDDDPDSLQTLSRLLTEYGWQTTLASNGQEALDVLEKTLPAAIVLDLMMPEMDGFEFLRQIQDEATLRSIPVVVMTGKTPSAEEEAFLRDRVAAVLTKGEASGADLLRSITERIKATGQHDDSST